MNNKMGFFKTVYLGTFYRFLRIWPLYAAIFIIVWKILPLFGNGPIFGQIFNNEVGSCNKQWPFMLLFVENWTYGKYETVAPVCLGWYWYIPNDFQMCFIGTILIALYFRSKLTFAISFISIALICLVFEAHNIISLNIGVNLFEQGSIFDNFKDFYIKFYNRCSPFWIGLLFGIIYYEYKIAEKEKNEESKIRKFINKIKESSFYGYLILLSGLLIMSFLWFIVYDSYKQKWSYFWKFCYLFFSRKLFVVGLFMFCLGLMVGKAKFISNFLSLGVFSTLAKLGFALYLIHPAIIKFTYYSFRQSFYFDPYILFMYSISFITIATILSCIFAPLFETPFANLRLLFEGESKKISKIESYLKENKEREDKHDNI